MSKREVCAKCRKDRGEVEDIIRRIRSDVDSALDDIEEVFNSDGNAPGGLTMDAILAAVGEHPDSSAILEAARVFAQTGNLYKPVTP